MTTNEQATVCTYCHAWVIDKADHRCPQRPDDIMAVWDALMADHPAAEQVRDELAQRRDGKSAAMRRHPAGKDRR